MSTIVHRLNDWAQKAPNAVAQRVKVNGSWQDITSQQFRDDVFHLALFLESKGFGPGTAGAILSYNRPEWVVAELATTLIRAKSVGLYPNASFSDIKYILGHTEATLLSVQNKSYFDRLASPQGDMGLADSLELVLVFEGSADFHPAAVSYADGVAEGRRLAQGKSIDNYLSQIDAHEGAFLIYTSGTTGNPKGALLSHDNILFASEAAIDWVDLHRGAEELFSFLPLCHVAEKVQNLGLSTTGHFTVNYCSAFENVASELPEVQPTLMFCVPRLWEKMMEGVNSKLKSAPPVRQKLANWALSVGRQVADAKVRGQNPGLATQIQFAIADKLVLSKVRDKLGLARARTCASGAASMSPDVINWFRALGVDVINLFGQTESTAIHTFSERWTPSVGAVGKALRGVDAKIAEDGEILSRGRHIFKGYYKNDEATAETVVDGWLHTGDLGKIDENGCLRIIGRKKEIMKTSGGKMVAPVPIEERVKVSPIVSQVCMVGDGKKYFSALITLAEDRLSEVQKLNGTGVKDGVVIHPDTIAEIKAAIEKVNQDLANYEKIKYFKVLADEFSVEKGEMTPTLKMKRHAIEKNFSAIIEQMYS